ncbi:MAG TPA: PilW family protein [Nitrospira sp.]|nr:PilW family protein [Nitrospira sp.]
MINSSNVSILNKQGFTLTEVMIAAAMSTAIIAAGLGALTVTQKTARITNQVVNTQTTARTGLDMITADLKLAGFGMAGLVGGPVGNCAVNGTPAALVPADNNTLGADFGPDSISMVVPMTNSITAVGPLWQLFPAAPGTIGGPNQPIVALPLANNATTGMGAAIPGGTAALPGMSVTVGGVVGSRIAAGGVTPTGLNLNPAIPAPATFGTGTQVYLLQCITYQVIPPPDPRNLCQGNAPCLVRGVAPAGVGGPPNCNNPGNACVPIMDGVEDLQLAYACDGCNINIGAGAPDGAIDDMNGSNSFDQGDFLTNINWFLPPSSAMTPNKIRMVQVNIVARQTRTDQGMGEANQIVVHSTAIPTVSDHNHATGVFALGDNNTPAQQQAYFQFRRRILSRTVELRNQRS